MNWKIWALVPLLYGLFSLWYFNWQGPLTEEEIEKVMQVFDGQKETANTSKALFRKFLEEDDGGDGGYVRLRGARARERASASTRGAPATDGRGERVARTPRARAQWRRRARACSRPPCRRPTRGAGGRYGARDEPRSRDRGDNARAVGRAVRRYRPRVQAQMSTGPTRAPAAGGAERIHARRAFMLTGRALAR